MIEQKKRGEHTPETDESDVWKLPHKGKSMDVFCGWEYNATLATIIGNYQ